LKIYRVLFFENRPTPIGHPVYTHTQWNTGVLNFKVR